MRALVFGASGMLGNAMMRILAEGDGWDVHGTLRSPSAKSLFLPELAHKLHVGVDVEIQGALEEVIDKVRPQLVVNCVGHVKQIKDAEHPLRVIPINSVFPHRLAEHCTLGGIRLVHVSTDCVFSGSRGGYSETDIPDAQDLYGRSKLLGELDYPNTITLRTSIIGHELQSKHGLIEWFLSQGASCKGYTRAIFSGLPTIVLAKIVRDIVAQQPNLRGLYHLASKPISKYDLLRLVAEIYGKDIEVIQDNVLKINRSLDAGRFHSATGYVVPEWSDLIKTMYAYR